MGLIFHQLSFGHIGAGVTEIVTKANFHEVLCINLSKVGWFVFNFIFNSLSVLITTVCGCDSEPDVQLDSAAFLK